MEFKLYENHISFVILSLCAKEKHNEYANINKEGK